jgi:hypothetical protein
MPLDLETPYRESDPLGMDDARAASRRASQMRRDAERSLIERGDEKADAEVDYKKARAVALPKDAGLPADVPPDEVADPGEAEMLALGLDGEDV